VDEAEYETFVGIHIGPGEAVLWRNINLLSIDSLKLYTSGLKESWQSIHQSTNY
jgi:hypothetical protein